MVATKLSQVPLTNFCPTMQIYTYNLYLHKFNPAPPTPPPLCVYVPNQVFECDEVRKENKKTKKKKRQQRNTVKTRLEIRTFALWTNGHQMVRRKRQADADT